MTVLPSCDEEDGDAGRIDLLLGVLDEGQLKAAVAAWPSTALPVAPHGLGCAA